MEVETSHPLILPRKAKGKTDREGEPKLGPFKRLVLSLLGHVYVEHRTYLGWDGELPFYAFKCPIHGIVEDYPHGHNDRLDCPICRLEARVLRDLTSGLSRR